MKYKSASIDLIDINTDDTGFKITTRSSIEDILPSIIDHGVINPPILTSKIQRGHRIVSGFRRIAAAVHLSLNKIDARIIDSNTDTLETIKVAICDNAVQRPLNLIEESNALNLLSTCIDDEDQLSGISANLGLPGNVSIIRKIKRLSSLPDEVQQSVAEGRISLAVALELGGIEKSAASYAALLFTNLKTGLNKQREILTNLMEISKREDITIMDIFNDPAFQALISDTDTDTAKKGNAVRTYLKERRFPSIIKAEKNFKNRLDELKLEKSMKLLPPKSFEGQQFELVLKFRDVKDLKYCNEEVTRLIDHPAMKDILLKQ